MGDKGKELLQEIEPQNISAELYPSEEDEGPTDSASMEKTKAIMQVDSKKKGVASSRNPKGRKSSNKKVSAGKSKKTGSTSQEKKQDSNFYDEVAAKFTCMERADKVLTLVQNVLKVPFFLKRMLHSNVSRGFWLHLPKEFSRVHFPSHDTTMILVDEWGNEYTTNYLIGRHGLSGGWRAFSIAHSLLEGDILIFHLIAPCKLQVHIVRVNNSDVVNAALCLMKGNDAETKGKRKSKRAIQYVEPFLPGLSKNLKGKSVQDQPPDSKEDSEGEGHHRSKNTDVCYLGLPFLQEHFLRGVVCR